MAFKQERFENFPDGTTFNTTNVGTFGEAGGYANISAGVGNTFTTTTADSAHGSSCLEIIGASAVAGQFDITDTAAPDAALSFYAKMLTTPSVTVQFPVAWRQAGGALGRLEMSSSRQIRCNMGAVGTFGTAWSLNQWMRVELMITGTGTAATAVTCNQYILDNTGTPFATDTITGQTTAAQMDRFRFFRTATEATGIQVRFDTIRMNIGDATPLGPPPTVAKTILPSQLWSPAAALRAASR